MEKAEIKRIADFLTDVHGGICEDDEPRTMQLPLSELYRIIPILMDETSKTKDEKLKTFLAHLNLRASECKQTMEAKLAVRN